MPLNAANSEAYSVLMSVYHKEKAENLRQAMNSMWAQTAATDDFVLVCDGPLTPELDAVIADMRRDHPQALRVVRLEKNGGLGNALNVGLGHCRHDLVARMDSDDISRPDRCEKELRAFAQGPELSIVSGAIEEFVHDPGVIAGVRALPEGHDAIVAFAKKRNPFNHMGVMYRRNAVNAAGGYQDFYLLEDYYLWIRMLQKGAVGRNIQEPLVWVRTGEGMYRRRGGWKYVVSQVRLFKYMRDTRFITSTQFLRNVVIRFASSLIPNGVRRMIYQKWLRS